MSAQERAEDLLVFYIRHVWEAAGLRWQGDNEAEVRSVVDAVLAAAGQQVREAEARISVLEGTVAGLRQDLEAVASRAGILEAARAQDAQALAELPGERRGGER